MILVTEIGKVRRSGLEGQDDSVLEHVESEVPLGHLGDIRWQKITQAPLYVSCPFPAP